MLVAFRRAEHRAQLRAIIDRHPLPPGKDRPYWTLPTMDDYADGYPDKEINQ